MYSNQKQDYIGNLICIKVKLYNKIYEVQQNNNNFGNNINT